jgi:multidrug transporter EmrE-like cation transporter
MMVEIKYAILQVVGTRMITIRRVVLLKAHLAAEKLRFSKNK